MTLLMVPLPGRLAGEINGTKLEGMGAQCPYCSRVHDEYDYETGKPLTFPENCGRCDSPMEKGRKAQEFADVKTAKEQTQWPEREAAEVRFTGVDLDQMASFLRAQNYRVTKPRNRQAATGQDASQS